MSIGCGKGVETSKAVIRGEGKRVRDEREKRVTSVDRLPGHGNFNVL